MAIPALKNALIDGLRRVIRGYTVADQENALDYFGETVANAFEGVIAGDIAISEHDYRARIESADAGENEKFFSSPMSVMPYDFDIEAWVDNPGAPGAQEKLPVILTELRLDGFKFYVSQTCQIRYSAQPLR